MDEERLQEGPQVAYGLTSKDGGCNTCTRQTGRVWIIQGANRSLQFRMCNDCLDLLRRATEEAK